MRLLIALIFCFFCSCAYLDEFIEDGTQSSLLKSPETKDKSSESQSKQGESKIQASEITKSYPGFNPKNLKQVTLPRSELSEIYTLPAHGSKAQTDIISVHQSGEILLKTAAGGYQKNYKLGGIAPKFTAVGFSGKNHYFAAAYPGVVEIYDLDRSEKIYSLSRLKTRVISLEFSPDGNALLMAGIDGVVYRWQFVLEVAAGTIADSEKSLERYIGHGSVANLVRYHPFGRVFVSSDWSGSINAWLLFDQDKYQGRFDENIFSGRAFSEEANRARGSRKAKDIIEQIRFTGDGQYFYAASEDGSMEVWLIRGFKQLLSASAHKGKIYDLSLNSKLGRAASIGRDGKLKIWQLNIKDSKVPGIKEYELAPLKEVILKDAGTVFARKIIYLNDNSILTASRDGSIKLIDVKI